MIIFSTPDVPTSLHHNIILMDGTSSSISWPFAFIFVSVLVSVLLFSVIFFAVSAAKRVADRAISAWLQKDTITSARRHSASVGDGVFQVIFLLLSIMVV